MNFKKVCLIASMLFIEQQVLTNKDQKTISLSCPLLRVADNAGIFHAPMVDILQSRIDFVRLVQGEYAWSGAVISVKVADSDTILTVYCKRPEILHGAAFIAIAPDHESATTIATAQHQQAVSQFIASRLNQNLYDRQMSSTNEAIFTGSYAINPFTQESLPVYISDYAIESFDIRKSKARIGVPAHNSKDLEIARTYNLPIKLVVDVQHHLQGKKDDMGPVVAAPLLDKHGNLTEAYLGEYAPCIVVNSGVLNNASLKDAAKHVIEHLKENNAGYAHTEILQYSYNNQLYSIKDLTKLESTLYKNGGATAQVQELKKELQVALNYIQADFLDIAEKFLINIKNTKSLMVALIIEDCEIRANNDCYLLHWTNLPGEFKEKEVFRRDIKSIRQFTLFCKDLVNFLGDFAHSCPKALENIRKQNS
ncbi:class I tRNA ligase family protein [Candidatus Babeliales bacterium]|nr:class I tRNA ligase family protein [Candidatus Babeliales bacterium]MBP9844275.1 class I tRNA ligase family protein [Candidatus Babeliales bacterium]